MERFAKPEQINWSRGNEMCELKGAVKSEMGSCKRKSETREDEKSDSEMKDLMDRRVLRSRYLAIKNLINDERDDMYRVESHKFKSIINEVESLHQQVQKPREQVADAEALLDIANTLAISVKCQCKEGENPSDFITYLLQKFGKQNGRASVDDAQSLIIWGDIGLAISHVFRKVPGCCTMLVPMNTKLKQRKTVVQTKRMRPTQSACPKELHNTGAEEIIDTDKNMSTMFDILRKNRLVHLENLVFNRKSFAQTVENIFALSFLVKDGRAQITVNGSGCHLVSPRNAPPACAVVTGDVSYSHFVFRFDFKDWKLMMNTPKVEEELMPHRDHTNVYAFSKGKPVPGASQSTMPTTPIRKFPRNSGLLVQKQSVVDKSPVNDYGTAKTSPTLK